MKYVKEIIRLNINYHYPNVCTYLFLNICLLLNIKEGNYIERITDYLFMTDLDSSRDGSKDRRRGGHVRVVNFREP